MPSPARQPLGGLGVAVRFALHLTMIPFNFLQPQTRPCLALPRNAPFHLVLPRTARQSPPANFFLSYCLEELTGVRAAYAGSFSR